MYWPIGAPECFVQKGLAIISTDLHVKPHAVDTDDAKAKGDGPLLDDNHINPSHSANHITKVNAESSTGNKVLETGVLVEETPSNSDHRIIGLRISRSGKLFATITRTALSIWQTWPAVVLGTVARSSRSLHSYGQNVSLLLRPDADTVVLQTAFGFLITYSVVVHPEHCVYMWHFDDGDKRHVRRHSTGDYISQENSSAIGDGVLAPSAHLRFRMVIKLDAGISKALALDYELVVATKKPAAVQCIRWNPGRDGTQTNTELLSRMDWLPKGSTLDEMFYDRPMNIFVFITDDGHAYAAQRLQADSGSSDSHKQLFQGHIFHVPKKDGEIAIKAAIASRFSLIALGCSDGSIWLYNVKDYAGGITLLRRLEAPTFPDPCGSPTCLVYSPDCYCLFAGYGDGWVTYSVYGQEGASSYVTHTSLDKQSANNWLSGIQDAAWFGAGSELMMLEQGPGRLWMIEFSRSAVTTCLTPANVSKALLLTSTGFMIYRGHEVQDVLTIAADTSLWHHVKIPPSYLNEEWPLRAAVVSSDGRYLAVAGQRGLAHYSFASARWKQFEEKEDQNSFFVRGGMCWYHHILIAAVEAGGSHELRVFSREAALSNARILQLVSLEAAVVAVSPSGGDSILVYTYDNVLSHFIISTSKKNVELLKVGQIALNGIIRAPQRVRGVSWIVPDAQLETGDSSRDVVVASVLFLVDGKLVLLQPSTSEDGGLKYDMKVLASHVEYYMLARDVSTLDMWHDHDSDTTSDFTPLDDSLWLFDGREVKIWPDVRELLAISDNDTTMDNHAAISIPVDCYPLSALLKRGILFGAEAELVQRRDGMFSFFRAVARTTLYLPQLLRHHISRMNFTAALTTAQQYQSLPYFAHALEILLHNVLDEEVDTQPEPEKAILPLVLSFLSTFPEYLDIIVQCARKTELRSWPTLFAYLPPPLELFEVSLERGALKTAGGYLLVLHNLEDVASTSPQVVRLLRSAKAAQDWDLCKELARFLVALDESGNTLRQALELVEVISPRPSDSINAILKQSVPNGIHTLTDRP